jgi:hypothetical protein
MVITTYWSIGSQQAPSKLYQTKSSQVKVSCSSIRQVSSYLPLQAKIQQGDNYTLSYKPRMIPVIKSEAQ